MTESKTRNLAKATALMKRGTSDPESLKQAQTKHLKPVKDVHKKKRAMYKRKNVTKSQEASGRGV